MAAAKFYDYPVPANFTSPITGRGRRYGTIIADELYSQYLTNTNAGYIKAKPTTYATSILDCLKEKQMKTKNMNFLVNGVWFKTLKKARKYATDKLKISCGDVIITERVETVRIAIDYD